MLPHHNRRWDPPPAPSFLFTAHTKHPGTSKMGAPSPKRAPQGQHPQCCCLGAPIEPQSPCTPRSSRTPPKGKPQSKGDPTPYLEEEPPKPQSKGHPPHAGHCETPSNTPGPPHPHPEQGPVRFLLPRPAAHRPAWSRTRCPPAWCCSRRAAAGRRRTGPGTCRGPGYRDSESGPGSSGPT